MNHHTNTPEASWHDARERAFRTATVVQCCNISASVESTFIQMRQKDKKPLLKFMAAATGTSSSPKKHDATRIYKHVP
jgi:hypothetical protein